jgi:thiol:disulfide interchange protein
VDYARGDGKAVGPGQPSSWDPVLIDDDTSWVRDYRGLWGLDTEDFFGGERAPSGPRYERDGSIRAPWANPLGWAGLLKVPPSDEHAGALLGQRVAALQRELAKLDRAIVDERENLRHLEVELRSLKPHGHARSLTETKRDQLLMSERALNQRIAQRADLAEELHTHLDTLSRPLPVSAPQAHIKKSHGPRAEEQQRRMRILRLWAALSTPLLLALVPVVLLASPLAWLATIVAAALLFLGMEAFARRRFLSFVASTLLLALTIGLAEWFVHLGHRYWRYALAAVFVVAALSLLAGNLGDLRQGLRRGGTIDENDDR